MRQISRITSKGQITIPKAVRDRLGLSEGDIVAFAVAGGAATMTRIETRPAGGGPEAAQLDGQLGEWAGPADAAAYRDL